MDTKERYSGLNRCYYSYRDHLGAGQVIPPFRGVSGPYTNRDTIALLNDLLNADSNRLETVSPVQGVPKSRGKAILTHK